jgi:predicted amidohydrolase
VKTIRAAAVQFQPTAGDKERNLELITRFAAQAASRGVELLCFPECCITGYWFLRNLPRQAIVDLAEPVFDGPASQKLGGLAKRHTMIIGAGLVEIDPEGSLYNSYVVAMPDGTFARHRKLHCFISEHMRSGDEVTVFDTPFDVRIAVLICYDNNIGENVRLTALKGAHVLLAPHQTGGCTTSSPFAMGRIDPALWHNRTADPQSIEAEFRGDKGRGWLMRWLPARAHDNGLFLVFSNGVGVDDDEIRTGNAMILDPYGRILAETWRASDEMVVADLDGSLIERSTGRRWLRTRRPELYGPLVVATGREEDTRTVRFE